jgi:hypothetical protein
VGPGGRRGAAVFYLNDTTILIFGGCGCDDSACLALTVNDLWGYNRATDTWTLLKGGLTAASSGYYGELNVPSSLNEPPARRGVSAYWTDRSTNSLYIFGGVYDRKWYNDLWKFSEGVWTWIGGSNTTDDDGYDSGLEVEDPRNRPSARQGAAACLDRHNRLWMFGGGTHLTASAELWTYRNGSWLWISGSKGNVGGTYPNKGIPISWALPKSRYDGNMVCDPNSDTLWIFGGNGFNHSYNGISCTNLLTHSFLRCTK